MLTPGIDIVLAAADESWQKETLKPILMVGDWLEVEHDAMPPTRERFDLWVLEGTALRGWNMIFMTEETMLALRAKGLLGYASEDSEADDDVNLYAADEEVSSVMTVEGDELFFALIHFDQGLDFSYCDPDADPAP